MFMVSRERYSRRPKDVSEPKASRTHNKLNFSGFLRTAYSLIRGNRREEDREIDDYLIHYYGDGRVPRGYHGEQLVGLI